MIWPFFYRPCRNGCPPDCFRIECLDGRFFSRLIQEANCMQCGKVAVAVVYSEYDPALANAWNMANAPMGQDEGIERAMS